MIFAAGVSLSGFGNAWYNKASILPLIQEKYYVNYMFLFQKAPISTAFLLFNIMHGPRLSHAPFHRLSECRRHRHCRQEGANQHQQY